MNDAEQSMRLELILGAGPARFQRVPAVGNLELGFVKGTMPGIRTTIMLIVLATMIARVAVAQEGSAGIRLCQSHRRLTQRIAVKFCF